ncbi:MAG: hypothetical protein ACI39G_01020 [Pseudoramibacter sp.]
MFDFHILWSVSPLVSVAMAGVVIFIVSLIFADLLFVYGRNSAADYLLKGVAFCGLLVMIAPLILLAGKYFVKLAINSELDSKLGLAMLILIAFGIAMVVLVLRGLADYFKNLPYILRPFTVNLTQCKFWEETPGDTTICKVGGTDEKGRARKFTIRDRDWKEAKKAFEQKDWEEFQITVTYLPYGNEVVGFEYSKK